MHHWVLFQGWPILTFWVESTTFLKNHFLKKTIKLWPLETVWKHKGPHGHRKFAEVIAIMLHKTVCLAVIYTTTEQASSTDEDHEMWFKPEEKAKFTASVLKPFIRARNT